MQCSRCGSDNDDSRIACWNCFAQLHPPAGGKPGKVEGKKPEPAPSLVEQSPSAAEQVSGEESPVGSDAEDIEAQVSDVSHIIPGLAEPLHEPGEEQVSATGVSDLSEEVTSPPVFGPGAAGEGPQPLVAVDESAYVEEEVPGAASSRDDSGFEIPADEEEPTVSRSNVLDLDEPAVDLAGFQAEDQQDTSTAGLQVESGFEIRPLEEDSGDLGASETDETSH